MRSRLFLSFLGAVALLAASAVQAGTLTSATWTQVTQGVPLTRTTAQLSASGSTTGGSVAASVDYPQFQFGFFVPGPPTNPTAAIALHITLLQGGTATGFTANGQLTMALNAPPQAITANNSGANGTPGIPGTVIVMTASHIGAGGMQSMFKIGTNTLVAVPVSIGKAGQFTSTFSVIGAAHQITVDFFAWTPHTLTFMGLTTKGAALPDVTAAGSFNLTGGGGGTVTLVSPSKISINGSLAQRRTAAFTSLKLNFIPEPSTLLLLGAGFAGLALLGRRQR